MAKPCTITGIDWKDTNKKIGLDNPENPTEGPYERENLEDKYADLIEEYDSRN